MIRTISRIKSEPWAITQSALETIIEIATRQNDGPEAVAARLGRPLENTYDVEYRDGVAILSVTGPMFRYANVMTSLSGATSYDLLARDFAKALDDGRVDAILLNIDSPGGEANGVSEFADQIYNARGRKPITAYIGGQGSSAAYWIASAADEIVISDTASLGSIGAVLGVEDTRARDEKNGVKRMEIVSAVSPFKRVDPATDEGRSRLQARVDALGEVFIDKVARNRGESRDTVLQEFGQGDVFVGAAAVDAGLADRVGTFEGVISELSTRTAPTGLTGYRASGATNEEIAMGEKDGAPAADQKPSNLTAAQVVEQQPQAAEQIRAEAHAAGLAEGVTAERARIQEILGSAEASDRRELAEHLAFEGDLPAAKAIAMLGKAPKQAKANAYGDLDARMRAEGNPQVGPDADAGDGDGGKDPGSALVNTAKAMGLA